MNTLAQKIESLLFYRNQPTSFTWLIKKLDCTNQEFSEALALLKSSYEGRGMELLVQSDELSLVTHKNCAEMIGEIEGEQTKSELSKQAFETLTIVLYNPGITKSEIDYIRGVNSVFILRNLLIRGLITKQKNEKDRRSPAYTASFDTLAHLGIRKLSDLPHYHQHLENFDRIRKEWNQENSNDEDHNSTNDAGEQDSGSINKDSEQN